LSGSSDDTWASLCDQAFEQFTSKHDRGYYLLTGELGGEEMIAARYAQSQDCLFYFNVGAMARTRRRCSSKISGQLIERYKLEKPAVLPPRDAEQCVPENAVKQASSKGKRVIVVDGLDEVDLDAQRGDGFQCPVLAQGSAQRYTSADITALCGKTRRAPPLRYQLGKSSWKILPKARRTLSSISVIS